MCVCMCVCMCVFMCIRTLICHGDLEIRGTSLICNNKKKETGISSALVHATGQRVYFHMRTRMCIRIDSSVAAAAAATVVKVVNVAVNSYSKLVTFVVINYSKAVSVVVNE